MHAHWTHRMHAHWRHSDAWRVGEGQPREAARSAAAWRQHLSRSQESSRLEPAPLPEPGEQPPGDSSTHPTTCPACTYMHLHAPACTCMHPACTQQHALTTACIQYFTHARTHADVSYAGVPHTWLWTPCGVHNLNRCGGPQPCGGPLPGGPQPQPHQPARGACAALHPVLPCCMGVQYTPSAHQSRPSAQLPSTQQARSACTASGIALP
jgi:hypothetical protein